MAEDHSAQHRKQSRFAARQSITTVGAACGESFAICSALGIIDGGVDELITMLGEARAYEEVMKIADRINVTKAQPAKS